MIALGRVIFSSSHCTRPFSMEKVQSIKIQRKARSCDGYDKPFPCEHNVTLTMKDGRTFHKVLNGHEIAGLIKKIDKVKANSLLINPYPLSHFGLIYERGDKDLVLKQLTSHDLPNADETFAKFFSSSKE